MIIKIPQKDFKLNHSQINRSSKSTFLSNWHIQIKDKEDGIQNVDQRRKIISITIQWKWSKINLMRRINVKALYHLLECANSSHSREITFGKQWDQVTFKISINRGQKQLEISHSYSYKQWQVTISHKKLQSATETTSYKSQLQQEGLHKKQTSEARYWNRSKKNYLLFQKYVYHWDLNLQQSLYSFLC